MLSLEIKNVSKSFFREDNSLNVVIKDLNLEIPDNSFNTIIGPNGCGKTTFLNLLADIYLPDEGEIIFNLNSNTKRIGYVWQDYRMTLLPWLTVSENITFPLRMEKLPKKERKKKAEFILNQHQITLEPKQRIYNLSGGQQQLVSILRGIIIEPDLLLFDEPLSALDQLNSWKMAFIIEKLWLTLKVPAFFVSHDIDEAVLLADNILLMSKKEKKITEVLRNSLPRPRTKNMLSSKEHILIRDKAIEFLFEEDKHQNHKQL